jgi:hypothetical protein
VPNIDITPNGDPAPTDVSRQPILLIASMSPGVGVGTPNLIKNNFFILLLFLSL